MRAKSRSEIQKGRPEGRYQAVEKPQESARGPQPSRILIVVGGMYGDHGADFSGRKFIFRKKNRFFAVFATGIACNSSKNWKAVAPMHEVQVRPARLNPLDSKAALPETPLRGGSGAL